MKRSKLMENFGTEIRNEKFYSDKASTKEILSAL